MSFPYINVETKGKYKKNSIWKKSTSPANEFLLHRYINNKKFTGPANEFLYIGTAKNCTSPANEFLLKKDVKMDKRTDIHLTPSR